MLNSLALQEAEFCLEFCTALRQDRGAAFPALAEAAPGGYVVQERFIGPPHLAAGTQALAPAATTRSGRNAPLVLLGHPDLPAQHAYTVARPAGESTTVEKHARAIRIRAPGMNLVFSAPLPSAAGSADATFLPVFQEIQGVLSAAGVPDATLARTWLFAADILGEYAHVNEARRRFFERWFAGPASFYPASTGIQGQFPGGEALSLEFCAFSGARVDVRRRRSPLQNEATAYGKLFSRAVAVQFPRNTLLYISGTASIDQSGASMHPGDFTGQVRRTMEIVEAALRKSGGTFAHVAQAIVYLKRRSDLARCLQLLDALEFPAGRTLFLLEAAVCRDELLFEMEATAVLPSAPEAAAAR